MSTEANRAIASPSSLADLIGRLEKATGPDRELEDKIWRAVNDGQWLFKGWRYDLEEAPTYTASIDQALTLVPESMKWSVGSWSGNFATTGRDTMIGEVGVENVASPAIALCIAALRAHASSQPETDPVGRG